MPSEISINQEDAFNFIVGCLRRGEAVNEHAYEVWLPKIIRQYHVSVTGTAPHVYNDLPSVLFPPFYSAAWELCRRGILRYGANVFQPSHYGAVADGYSVTLLGREWLEKAGHYDQVPTEPGRFAKLLENFNKRFGAGYSERSQEAIRCYSALAYLSCCAMCGAAAESVVLALAIAKKSDEGEVLKIYMAAGGRVRIENLLIGKSELSIQTEYRSSANLLKYWRDNASHGRLSGIGEGEAFTSLAVLLRFAQFANDRWDELTRP